MPFDEKLPDESVIDPASDLPMSVVIRLLAIVVLMCLASASFTAFYFTTTVCPVR